MLSFYLFHSLVSFSERMFVYLWGAYSADLGEERPSPCTYGKGGDIFHSTTLLPRDGWHVIAGCQGLLLLGWMSSQNVFGRKRDTLSREGVQCLDRGHKNTQKIVHVFLLLGDSMFMSSIIHVMSCR